MTGICTSRGVAINVERRGATDTLYIRPSDRRPTLVLSDDDARRLAKLLRHVVDPAPRRARLEVPVGEWLSANDRDMHWARRSKITNELRKAAWALAVSAKIEPFTYVLIDAFVIGTGTDPGNCYPTIKACIDGLVDAHVLPNDTKKQVRALTLHAPRAGKTKSVVLVVSDAGTPEGTLL